MKMKRFFAMLLFAAVFCTFLAGCTVSKRTEETTETPTAPEPERERDENGQFVFDVPDVMNGLYCSPGLDFANSEDVEGSDYVNCVILSAYAQDDLAGQIRLAIKNGNAFWINTQFLERGIVKDKWGRRYMAIAEDWQSEMDKVVATVR